MASTTPLSPATPQVLEPEEDRNEKELSTPPSSDIEPKPNLVSESALTIVPAAEELEWVSGVKLLSVITGVTLVCFLMLLDTSIVVTAIPRITSDFHSLPDVGWYGSAYQLASTALQPLTGKLYMNFKSKWTFITFFAVFELGSLICAIASSSRMLIAGRAVAGMGTSGMLNGALTIIAECVPMPKRPAVSQFGLVIGPLIGGVLTQYATWRWCFYINLPIGGAVAAMLIFVRIPDKIPKPKPMSVIRTLPSKLDLIGFALFAPAAIQLLLALQYGGIKFAWNSRQIIGLFCGAGATFVLFLAWDYYKGDAAMIPYSMVRKRTVWASCLVYGFLMGQLFCVSYYLPIYFQGVKGASPTLSGVYVLPGILSHVISSLGSGLAVGKLGYYLPFSVGSAVLIAIGNGLLSTLSPSTPTGKWIGYQIIIGVGRGFGLQMPIIAVQNTLPFTEIPIAMALVMFSQSLGGALFLSFSETIFTNSLQTLIPKYAPSVDPQIVINAGATGFRTMIKGADLAGVLVAYAKSVDRVFYLTVGAAVGCFSFAWAMGWKDIRKKKQVSKA
ncbi:hypothetical protein OIDMADRAFT_44464 [Oidiodendron maius Zn]|uniref:Major facilitator superfamily (MFS) profile domain-containing protein n=1 Tax=Oidiodendron maius (strain Zn) TaxID=913774 RepID=A0A0C3H0W2_OIDMZ|nr:hypothetical protein OIDMADRAFT_44464 [Oidiodendron maius Zn]